MAKRHRRVTGKRHKGKTVFYETPLEDSWMFQLAKTLVNDGMQFISHINYIAEISYRNLGFAMRTYRPFRYWSSFILRYVCSVMLYANPRTHPEKNTRTLSVKIPSLLPLKRRYIWSPHSCALVFGLARVAEMCRYG